MKEGPTLSVGFYCPLGARNVPQNEISRLSQCHNVLTGIGFTICSCWIVKEVRHCHSLKSLLTNFHSKKSWAIPMTFMVRLRALKSAPILIPRTRFSDFINLYLIYYITRYINCNFHRFSWNLIHEFLPVMSWVSSLANIIQEYLLSFWGGFPSKVWFFADPKSNFHLNYPVSLVWAINGDEFWTLDKDI